MGELSWYHERHAAYVEVWRPETFSGPAEWRRRARSEQVPTVREVVVLVPHPHDLLCSKLERFDENDRDHIRRILLEFPLGIEQLRALAATMPHQTGIITDPDRLARFHHGLARVERMIERR